jgi:hypothetical protein
MTGRVTHSAVFFFALMLLVMVDLVCGGSVRRWMFFAIIADGVAVVSCAVAPLPLLPFWTFGMVRLGWVVLYGWSQSAVSNVIPDHSTVSYGVTGLACLPEQRFLPSACATALHTLRLRTTCKKGAATHALAACSRGGFWSVGSAHLPLPRCACRALPAHLCASLRTASASLLLSSLPHMPPSLCAPRVPARLHRHCVCLLTLFTLILRQLLSRALCNNIAPWRRVFLAFLFMHTAAAGAARYWRITSAARLYIGSGARLFITTLLQRALP